MQLSSRPSGRCRAGAAVCRRHMRPHLEEVRTRLATTALASVACSPTSGESANLCVFRYKEIPQRPWNVWMLDVSKQGFSSLAAHLCSIVISIIAHTTAPKASECAWYWIVFTTDTILGTAIAVALHNAIVALAQKMHAQNKACGKAQWSVRLWDWIRDSGNYGNPVSYSKWGVQLTEWMLMNIISRVVCGFIIIPLSPLLQVISEAVDYSFRGHPNVLLFSVMVAWPMLMNMAQAWVQDQVLKWKRQAGTHAQHGSRDSICLLPLEASLPACDAESIAEHKYFGA
jgi:hypothetical protein